VLSYAGQLGQARSQLSRSRAVLTHSQARAPRPNTPQAAQPGATADRAILGMAWLEGRVLEATHWPLLTVLGAVQVHIVGFFGGEVV
jgi:hypothetical protein